MLRTNMVHINKMKNCCNLKPEPLLRVLLIFYTTEPNIDWCQNKNLNNLQILISKDDVQGCR